MTLGSDFSGGYDLDPAMREVTGQRALAEAVVRRLTTTTGALQDHPDYGFNLSNLIGTSLTTDRIKQGILGQIFLEEEIESATVSVVKNGETLEIDIVLFSGDGPFNFTLSVDDVGVNAIIPPEV